MNLYCVLYIKHLPYFLPTTQHVSLVIVSILPVWKLRLNEFLKTVQTTDRKCIESD